MFGVTRPCALGPCGFVSISGVYFTRDLTVRRFGERSLALSFVSKTQIVGVAFFHQPLLASREERWRDFRLAKEAGGRTASTVMLD